ncbi:hypothetical protein ACERII_19305 [Evansella sp. AB-rgal1]|uniref:hypothetical protein n=1 Tax=Evansella sp. AB-rgal1 TaxID=3242696 RepID=UPI00359E3B90
MSHFDGKNEIVESINNKMKLSDSEKNEIFSQIKDRIHHKKKTTTSMRYKYYLTLASASFIFLLLLFPTFSSFFQDSSSGQWGGEVPSEVVEVVNKYFEALGTGDIDTVVQYSHDTRHTNKAEQKVHYARINEPTTETEILEIRRVTSDEYEVTALIFENDEVLELRFPVKKMEIGWQVIVGMDIVRE